MLFNYSEEELFAGFHQVMYSVVAFTEDEWQDIKSRATSIEISKGELFIREGHIERNFYFIVEGATRIFTIKNGEEITAAFCYTNTFTGDYGPFLGEDPSQFYNQAVTNTLMLSFTKRDLSDLYDKYRNMERWGRIVLQEVAVQKAHREVELLKSTAEERFTRLITQSPHVFQLYSQKDIATYLAMRPETLSRLRASVKI